LRDAQGNLKGEKATREMHLASTEQRLKFLEKQIGDSAENHLVQRVAHEDHVATMEQRLGFIERQMGDSADTAMLRQEMDRDKKSRDRILDAHSELKEHHANLRERIDYLEKFIGESADKHSKLLEEAQTKIKDQSAKMQQMADAHGGHTSTMEERLEDIEKYFKGVHEQHAGAIDDLTVKLKDAHVTLRGEKSARDEHHATTEQRLKFLEGQIGDSAETHLKQIEELERKHKLLANNMDQVHSNVKGEKDAREKHHSSINERVEYLEQFVGDSSDKHQEAAKQLEAYQNKLKDVHGNLSKQQA